MTRWLPAKSRWEVMLRGFTPGEVKLKVAVRPVNLEPCLQDPAGMRAFALDSAAAAPAARPEPKASTEALAKLRAAASSDADGACAICMEPTSDREPGQAVAAWCRGDSGGVSRLPCGHIFHFGCVLPWLTREKAECPCCRRAL